MKSDFKCPHCGRDYKIDGDELYDCVTYWGDEGVKELECYGCEKLFFINEVVVRSYNVGKTADEALWS